MNSIAFRRYANKIEFQKNLAENKGEKRMGKYGDGKKSKEAIKKLRLLDQEFKKTQNEPHDEQATLDRYSRNQIEEIQETIQQGYDGFHKTVQKIVKSLNKSNKIYELSETDLENFIRPLNVFLGFLKNKNWISH